MRALDARPSGTVSEVRRAHVELVLPLRSNSGVMRALRFRGVREQCPDVGRPGLPVVTGVCRHPWAISDRLSSGRQTTPSSLSHLGILDESLNNDALVMSRRGLIRQASRRFPRCRGPLRSGPLRPPRHPRDARGRDPEARPAASHDCGARDGRSDTAACLTRSLSFRSSSRIAIMRQVAILRTSTRCLTTRAARA